MIHSHDELITILICQRDYTIEQMATILSRYYKMDSYLAYKEVLKFIHRMDE